MESNKKVNLLVIVGPTASGKTDLAIELARLFDGEIVCADSRTIYKYLDVGTAKPSISDQQIVPHHLINVIDPDVRFSAGEFKKLANKAIIDIRTRSKLPILVGGSGLYIDSVIYDYSFSDSSKERDPNNPRHLAINTTSTKNSLDSSTFIVGLDPGREVLKERIALRAQKMLQDGLIKEADMLLKKYGKTAPSALSPAYKALFRYFDEEITLEQAKQEFIRNDYLLAKRQMTWFKRNKSIHWAKNREIAVEIVTTHLNKKIV